MFKRNAILPVVLLCSSACFAQVPSTQPAIRVPHNELKKLSWQLAVPTGIFTDKTVFQAIDLLHEQDIHHLELSPGQLLGAETPDQKAGESLPDAAINALLAKLKSHHMDIVSYGPVQFGSNEQSNRGIFEFARKIKAKNIHATAKNIGQIDKLANEFQISVALQDSGYRTADAVQTALAATSNRIGGDGDCSTWTHPAEAAQLLHGRFVQLRIKQLDAGVVDEFKKQNFKGVVTIAIAPGDSATEVDKFITSVNQLADVLQK